MKYEATLKGAKELYESLSEKERKDIKQQLQTNMAKALSQAGEMRQNKELSKAAYEKVMDEFVLQNPMYVLLMRGDL